EGLPLRVHLEDLPATVAVGPIDDDLPVEAAGAQKRRVEDVRTVRRRDQDDVVLQFEPVHLDEELVQGLLALVVATAEPGTPATSLKPIFGESGAIRLARLLPKLITFEPPPCTWFIRKIQKPKRRTNGSNEVRIDHHGDEPVPFESKVTPFFWSWFWKRTCDWSLG